MLAGLDATANEPVTCAFARPYYDNSHVVEHYNGGVISCYGDHIEEAPLARWRRPPEEWPRREVGPPLNARTIIKLLGNRKVRQGVVKLLKNPTIRRMVIKQITRRLGRR